MKVWHGDAGWGVLRSADVPEDVWFSSGAIEGSDDQSLDDGAAVRFQYRRANLEGFAYVADSVHKVERGSFWLAPFWLHYQVVAYFLPLLLVLLVGLDEGPASFAAAICGAVVAWTAVGLTPKFAWRRLLGTWSTPLILAVAGLAWVLVRVVDAPMWASFSVLGGFFGLPSADAWFTRRRLRGH